jgi:hypothetical protein
MTTETRTTPAALVSVYGPTYRFTGDRCADNRPIFTGSNGHTACGCSDH